ncbi:MAG: peptidylprolyl isomerase [Agriterribacter sp.]
MKQILLINFFIMMCLLSNSQTKQPGILADKIVAVVGDKIILQSDVINIKADNDRNGTAFLSTDDCSFFQKLLMQKILMLQAQKDSLPVSDEAIDAELEQRIRYYIHLYGTKQALEEIAGKSIYQIKEDNAANIKQQQLAEAQQRSIVERVTITPHEVKNYYNSIPQSELQFYESGFEISQIVLYAKPNPEAEKYTKDELNLCKRKIENGELTFEMAAQLFNNNENEKKSGGFFECNRNDKTMGIDFLEAAFSLKKEGQLSRVVKSKEGYYLIQLMSKNGDDITGRYIFKQPHVNPDAISTVVAQLDTIRFRLISNALSFSQAVNQYSEDVNSKLTAGAIINPAGESLVTIKQVDRDIVAVLDQLNVGEYSRPMLFTDANGKSGARILYVTRKTPPHIENLKDDYNKIAQRLMTKKKNEVLLQWFQNYLSHHNITIAKEYQACK